MGCCFPLGASLFGRDKSTDATERRLLEEGTHDESLPKPAEIVHIDYRKDRESAYKALQAGRPLRIVQWNIERGYKIDKIVQSLAKLDADVLILQEIDVGCDRSGNKDVGSHIAQALGMNYVFLCEFIELRSTLRDAHAQGGGVHGNAILTRLDVASAECVTHTHHPVEWGTDTHRFAQKEPREGERLTLAATVRTPVGLLQLYSAHLEVFCGPIGRLRQFADVLTHSRAAADSGVPQQVIGGDLNTMAHGIARFSPFHCTDHLRWSSLGSYEAHLWQEFLFDVPDDAPGDSGCRNERLWQLGLRDEALCRVLKNPGFVEVFPIDQTTLDNPHFRLLGLSLMEGKLDWLLHRGGLEVVESVMGNHDYDASDHKWLAADFRIMKGSKIEGELPPGELRLGLRGRGVESGELKRCSSRGDGDGSPSVLAELLGTSAGSARSIGLIKPRV